MVFIHGGGFIFGSGDDLYLRPDYLMRKNIVLVTFNYRLGIFGFLNLEDEVAPGNQGLKDMIMVPKWVQANIDRFNGYFNNVTLFGESAGAGAVCYLLQSPLTDGLVHKATCQSNSGFNPWIRNKDPKNYTIYSPFGPGPDPKAKVPVLPIPIEEASEAGIRVPLLIGHNSEEGLSGLVGMIPKSAFIGADKTFSKMINPRQPEYFLKTYDLTLKDLRNLYYGKEKITPDNHMIYARICKNGFGKWKKGTTPYKIMKRMRELWANFATYGLPTLGISELLPVKWEPVNDVDELKYLNLDKEIEMKVVSNIEERFRNAKTTIKN
ncbi:hypothetical protein QAD02_004312 [Eretmocerus hayati]|uniref:Uncharacterized protein n=1 Tax=Eretmocerus hayati TaxID=131215 RepID=A0ACC2NQ91_9HYME|nr:hypothetical protein QAD02_004312 [Eretmocerus hayati]